MSITTEVDENSGHSTQPTRTTAQIDTFDRMKPDNVDASEGKLPLHEDIMQLARLGEIGPIQKLLDEGKFKADYKDAENITPLHVRYTGLDLTRTPSC